MCDGLASGWHVEDYSAGGHEPALFCFFKGDLTATVYVRDQDCWTWLANGNHDKPYEVRVAASADLEDENLWDYIQKPIEVVGFLEAIEQRWVKTRGAHVVEYLDQEGPKKCLTGDQAAVAMSKQPSGGEQP